MPFILGYASDGFENGEELRYEYISELVAKINGQVLIEAYGAI